MKRIFLSILYVLLLIGGYFLIFRILPYYDKKNNGCSIHKEIYDENINFKVEKKIIDSKNHNNQVLIITINNRFGKMYCGIELQEMYDFLEKGDSVFKKSGSLKYRVKSNRSDTIFKINSLCKDSVAKQR